MIQKITRLSCSPSPFVASRLASPAGHRCQTRHRIVTRYRSATVTGSHGLPCICETAAKDAHHVPGLIKKTCRFGEAPRHDEALAVLLPCASKGCFISGPPRLMDAFFVTHSLQAPARSSPHRVRFFRSAFSCPQPAATSMPRR